jgi:hypothetical protein
VSDGAGADDPIAVLAPSLPLALKPVRIGFAGLPEPAFFGHLDIAPA